MRILIVDDDKNTVETLSAGLSADKNNICDTATNSLDALGKLTADGPYDIVLLDVMMPEISGIDLCKIISKNDKLNKIPVLLISALPIEAPVFARSIGLPGEIKVVKGFLEKPFLIKDLVKKINSIVLR